MNTKKLSMRLLIWLLIVALMIPPVTMAQGERTPPAKFTKEEIAQMVAPIALYPDSLVAQILMASTYPLDIVEAERWVKQNPKLKGDALDAAVKDKSWDPSVKSLCHFPDVLSAMSQNLDKTSKLGDAVLSQQKEVMDVIQELRHKAQATGNLKTAEQQIVSVDPADPQVIVIQPANPEVVYVPSYSPTVVYGAWPYPAYPPYGYYPYYPGYALAGAAIGFGVGLAVGAAWGGWSNCNWGGGNINVNYNRANNFNNINRVNPLNNRGGNQNWRHNSANRRGVAYRDNATAQRFGQSPARSRESRQTRGYGGGTGQQNLQQRRSQTGGMGQQGRQGGQFQQSRGGGGSYGSRGSSGSLGGSRGGSRGNTFTGMGNGGSERRASQRGQSSRSRSYQGGRSRGGYGGSRGGGGGSRGGGGGRGGGRGGGGGRRR